jgi:Fur family zinc uptake transcriptional regulator
MKKKNTSTNKKTDQLVMIAEQKLVESGFKLTSPRLNVLQVLIDATEPMTTPEIFAATKEKIDRVSAYRIIELFKKLKLVHSVGESKLLFCSHLDKKEDTHLYLVCESCEEVDEIDLPSKIEHSIVSQISAHSGFESHGSLQISGLCQNCK